MRRRTTAQVSTCPPTRCFFLVFPVRMLILRSPWFVFLSVCFVCTISIFINLFEFVYCTSVCISVFIFVSSVCVFVGVLLWFTLSVFLCVSSLLVEPQPVRLWSGRCKVQISGLSNQMQCCQRLAIAVTFSLKGSWIARRCNGVEIGFAIRKLVIRLCVKKRVC